MKLCFILLLSLLPGACHLMTTSPWLINHGSSAAFDMAVGMWIFNFGLPLVAYIRLKD